MAEFFSNLFDFYKERIESPFVFTFALVWLVVNRSFVFLILFYEGTDKHQVLLNYQFDVMDYFFLPLLYSSVYVVFVPFFNNSLQWVKYGILNIIQDKVQYSKSAYLDAMELKKLRIEMKSFAQERANFENEKLKKANEIESLNSLNEDLVTRLRDVTATVERDGKLSVYFTALLHAMTPRAKGAVVSINATSKVTNSCSIIFYDENRSRVTPPIYIEDLVSEFDMSFNDFINIYQHGAVNDLYEFYNSKKELIKLRIKEIQHVTDAGVVFPAIPFDIKYDNKPVI